MGQALFGKGKERGRVWQTSGVPTVTGSSAGRSSSSRVAICCERSKLPVGFENARFNSKRMSSLGSQVALGHAKSDALASVLYPRWEKKRPPNSQR